MPKVSARAREVFGWRFSGGGVADFAVNREETVRKMQPNNIILDVAACRRPVLILAHEMAPGLRRQRGAGSLASAGCMGQIWMIGGKGDGDSPWVAIQLRKKSYRKT